jgi:uncharacterized membrane protein YhhN
LLPLLIPVVLVSGYRMIKAFRLISFAGSVLAASIPLIIYGFIKMNNSGAIFHHYLVTDWSLFNYFKNSFTTLDGFSQYSIPNILFVFSYLVHPGFLFPGAIFIVLFFIKKRQPSLLWPLAVAGVLLYLLFIAGIPSRNIRYLIPVMPFYLAVCFPSFMSVLSFFHNKKNVISALMVVTVVIQGILALRAFIPFYEFNQSEKRLAQKINEYHPAVLYTFGIDGALRSYGYKGQIINLWDRPLDSVRKDAMLLFNRQGNELQWKGRNPMLNYYLIVDSAKAVKMEILESGWEIYEIKEAYTPAGAGFSPR